MFDHHYEPKTSDAIRGCIFAILIFLIPLGMVFLIDILSSFAR